jgi:hypothetical protein
MRPPPPGRGPGAATAAHDTAAHTGPLSPRAALSRAVTTLLTSTSGSGLRFACSISFLYAGTATPTFSVRSSQHTDTVAAVFTCTHCNAVPEPVVNGKAAIAIVRHEPG